MVQEGIDFKIVNGKFIRLLPKQPKERDVKFLAYNYFKHVATFMYATGGVTLKDKITLADYLSFSNNSNNITNSLLKAYYALYTEKQQMKREVGVKNFTPEMKRRYKALEKEKVKLKQVEATFEHYHFIFYPYICEVFRGYKTSETGMTFEDLIKGVLFFMKLDKEAYWDDVKTIFWLDYFISTFSLPYFTEAKTPAQSGYYLRQWDFKPYSRYKEGEMYQNRA